MGDQWIRANQNQLHNEKTRHDEAMSGGCTEGMIGRYGNPDERNAAVDLFMEKLDELNVRMNVTEKAISSIALISEKRTLSRIRD